VPSVRLLQLDVFCVCIVCEPCVTCVRGFFLCILNRVILEGQDYIAMQTKRKRRWAPHNDQIRYMLIKEGKSCEEIQAGAGHSMAFIDKTMKSVI